MAGSRMSADSQRDVSAKALADHLHNEVEGREFSCASQEVRIANEQLVGNLQAAKLFRKGGPLVPMDCASGIVE